MPYAPKNAFVDVHAGAVRPAAAQLAACSATASATSNASVLQVLSLANHPRVRQKIADDKGHVARILKEQADDAERVEEVFLLTLSRTPSAAEREACLKYIGASATPAEGLRGRDVELAEHAGVSAAALSGISPLSLWERGRG